MSGPLYFGQLMQGTSYFRLEKPGAETTRIATGLRKTQEGLSTIAGIGEPNRWRSYIHGIAEYPVNKSGYVITLEGNPSETENIHFEIRRENGNRVHPKQTLAHALSHKMNGLYVEMVKDTIALWQKVDQQSKSTGANFEGIG